MLKLPQKLLHSIQQLSRLPGIGERSATRHSLFLASWSQDELLELSDAIRHLTELKACQECGLLAEESRCDICTQPSRKESHRICVVENISDAMAIENSGIYQGLYHSLGGVLNPLANIGPDDLNIGVLARRLDDLAVDELILALNPSVEGDATCSYLKELFSAKCSVERLGFGIPIGGHLEYLDPLTISKAFENKKIL